MIADSSDCPSADPAAAVSSAAKRMRTR
jgi:hypothetical protein